VSINAMTNVALSRRPDFEPAEGPPHTSKARAAAAGGARPLSAEAPPPPQPPPPPDAKLQGVDAALKTLTTYVPTEILTLYVAAMTAFPAAKGATSGRVDLFWIFLALTPLVVWIVFAIKVRKSNTAAPPPFPKWPGQWPLFEMFAATAAFAAWAFAMPQSPFAGASWYSSGAAGFAVLTASIVLNWLATLFGSAPLSR
jgi:hypothetical protein